MSEQVSRKIMFIFSCSLSFTTCLCDARTLVMKELASVTVNLETLGHRCTKAAMNAANFNSWEHSGRTSKSSKIISVYDLKGYGRQSWKVRVEIKMTERKRKRESVWERERRKERKKFTYKIGLLETLKYTEKNTTKDLEKKFCRKKEKTMLLRDMKKILL